MTTLIKDQNKIPPASDGISKSPSDQLEKYNAALAATRYEGTLLWQIFSVFLVIHTAIAGFVVQGIDAHMGACKDIRILLASVIGLLLSILWTATYIRNSAHYRFYLARARKYEPDGWHLYGGHGELFSVGNRVSLNANKMQLPILARLVRSGRMIPPVICVFSLVYILGISTGIAGCFLGKKPPQVVTVRGSAGTNSMSIIQGGYRVPDRIHP